MIADRVHKRKGWLWIILTLKHVDTQRMRENSNNKERMRRWKTLKLKTNWNKLYLQNTGNHTQEDYRKKGKTGRGIDVQSLTWVTQEHKQLHILCLGRTECVCAHLGGEGLVQHIDWDVQEFISVIFTKGKHVHVQRGIIPLIYYVG